MTLDELKNQWKQTSLKVEQLEYDNALLTRELQGTRLLPSIDRLRRSYRGMMIIGWIMLVGTYPLFYRSFGAFWPSDLLVPAILWAILFAISVCADTWLYLNVRKTDVSTMPVEEVAGRAIRGRKVHLISQCLMIPVAVALLWLLFVGAPVDAKIAMVIGGTIGCAIGLYKWLQIMRAYRTLSNAE